MSESARTVSGRGRGLGVARRPSGLDCPRLRALVLYLAAGGVFLAVAGAVTQAGRHTLAVGECWSSLRSRSRWSAWTAPAA